MCEPVSLLAAAGSLVTAGLSYASNASMVNAQKKANNDWVAYQRAQAREASAKDESMRQAADAARQESLQKMTPEAEQAAQKQQQDTLNTEMLANNVAGDQNVKMLSSAQDQGDGDAITSDMQKRITSAARDARSRIQALAGLTSTQGGYNSMTQQVGRALDKSGQEIQLQGDMRGGTNKVLGVAQAVQPVQYDTSGAGNPFGGISSALAGLAGSAFQASAANPLKH
jgi:hypothetical protein